MQKTTITLQDYTVDNGKLIKGIKTATVFAASSRGTNCALRDLQAQGESVVKHESEQTKVDKTATENAVRTLAASQYKNDADRNAFFEYVMNVLTSANLFKTEKIIKA